MVWTRGRRTLNIHYFRQLRHFFAKSRKNANFKNHVKNVQLMKLLKPNAYINFVSITFCKQNCVSLPSSLFLKTGVKVARFSDNQLQNCWATPRFSVYLLLFSPLPPSQCCSTTKSCRITRVISIRYFFQNNIDMGEGGTKISFFSRVAQQFCNWLSENVAPFNGCKSKTFASNNVKLIVFVIHW